MIIGTLDTKGDEISYLKDAIVKRGHNALMMDLSMGRQPNFKAKSRRKTWLRLPASIDPTAGDPSRIVIEANWGLGESGFRLREP